MVRRAKNVDLLAQNVVAVRIRCWNYSRESICFSDGKCSDTRNSETGAEEYTIPASNAFGLPHRFPVCQSYGSLSGRIPETLRQNLQYGETGDMKKMILFVTGIFIGSAVGVIAMCILQVNRK